jgi:hypothetical protein
MMQPKLFREPNYMPGPGIGTWGTPSHFEPLSFLSCQAASYNQERRGDLP